MKSVEVELILHILNSAGSFNSLCDCETQQFETLHRSSQLLPSGGRFRVPLGQKQNLQELTRNNRHYSFCLSPNRRSFSAPIDN